MKHALILVSALLLSPLVVSADVRVETVMVSMRDGVHLATDINNFTRMQQLGKDPATRKQQRLILGPWDHGTIGKSRVGDLDFGSEAEWDSTAATLDWFDRTLKETADSEVSPSQQQGRCLSFFYLE